MARAVEIYAKRQKLGQESIAYAHTIVIDAQRLLGEFLARQKKNTGAMGIGKSVIPVGDCTLPPTLESVGISLKDSSQAQFIAKVAEGRLGRALRRGSRTRDLFFPARPSPHPLPGPPRPRSAS